MNDAREHQSDMPNIRHHQRTLRTNNAHLPVLDNLPKYMIWKTDTAIQ
ncbi:hypothetical protein A1Q_2197 [Vibrio campbellii HY01]|nr:hypothetical protein A1Q_2197 [Vibrio campbellii HY01]